MVTRSRCDLHIPCQPPRALPGDLRKAEAIRQEVDSLLTKGARHSIEDLAISSGFYLQVFVVPNYRLTVVQAKIVYWSGLKSETISGPPPPTIGSTATPVPVVTASQDLVTSNGCGDTKGCYLSPNDCVNKDDCDVLVSWRQDNDNIIFELLGKMRMGEEYIAIGFSTDLSMGDDDVWGCINEGGVAVLDHSTNVGRDNIPQST
ncbi:putative ferric-chelate reductase 1, partial [Saccoglossus kowalevskii]|uniref:Ferric-chelate reductase 1-like n=1 Tax=Saccoglossus kowalevskii TaxID=10224 RepID=A0ABM0N0M1_SACKO